MLMCMRPSMNCGLGDAVGSPGTGWSRPALQDRAVATYACGQAGSSRVRGYRAELKVTLPSW